MPDLVVWAAVVELLGLAALPVLRSAFGNRRDAALLSRLTGLALAAYGGWALSLLPGIPFERRTLAIAAVVLGAVSWVVFQRGRARGDEAFRGSFWGPEETRAALLFWIPAAVFLFIRSCLPEILGQEKFMDLAFTNSLVRNRAMPPLDPWMSGRTINYYYWGYLLAASLIRLSGVVTTVGYNLTIATFAGYSFSAAACLGFRLSAGRMRTAVLSGFAAVFAGDLAGAGDALKAPLGSGFDYWHASRVIGAGKTINEFPFFTFFHADLHPHLLAYPFFLAAFAFATRLLEVPSRAPGQPAEGGWTGRVARAWPLFLLAFLAGTARAANNWLLPAVAILMVFVSILRVGRPARLPGAADAVWGLIRGGLLVLLSLVLWWPYTSSYVLLRPKQGSTLAATTMKSGLLEFLLFWGTLFLAVLVGLFPREAAADETSRRRRDLAAAGIAGASVLAALWLSAPALLAIVPLLLLAGAYTFRALRGPEPDPPAVATGFLLLLGLSIVAGCEFVYFRDSYGLELQRMNTIFKFYNQAWPLIGIAAAVLGERAWREAARFRTEARIALASVVVVSLLYPLDAALSRLRMHEGAVTLDAFPALLKRSPGDAAAIAWLSSHAPAGSVVLEASGNPYTELARISSHTGIPTVMGWANHEGLWRNNEQEVADRAALVKVFYEGRDERVALLFCQKYKVTHVVLGDMERQTYPTADKIADYLFLAPVFPEPGKTFPGMTIVYAVRSSFPPAPAPR